MRVQQTAKVSLTRFAWLSVAAAIATIALKTSAYFLTGSVGILSDALESLVNLAGAVIALVMLSIAAKPPDEDHEFGHGKAEYFASGAEGAMIIFAAGSIAVAAVNRLLNPQPLEQVGLGLAVTLAATLINLLVAIVIRRAGKEYHSVTLDANARHLMTDVWTSAGVIAAVGIVALSKLQFLDPVIALVVAANIIREGIHIVRSSVLGLMDTAIPAEEHARIVSVLQSYEEDEVTYHALRTRQAGRRRFVSVHILVPGDWTVHQGHEMLEQIENKLIQAVPNITVLTHLESLEDPASWKDIGLDRAPE
ncbi:cation transporter [bacterium]|nr:cation transporter [bacterium]